MDDIMSFYNSANPRDLSDTDEMEEENEDSDSQEYIDEPNFLPNGGPSSDRESHTEDNTDNEEVDYSALLLASSVEDSSGEADTEDADSESADNDEDDADPETLIVDPVDVERPNEFLPLGEAMYSLRRRPRVMVYAETESEANESADVSTDEGRVSSGDESILVVDDSDEETGMREARRLRRLSRLYSFSTNDADRSNRSSIDSLTNGSQSHGSSSPVPPPLLAENPDNHNGEDSQSLATEGRLENSIHVASTSKDDQASASRPTKQLTAETDEETQSCSICFEPWSNSGEHRIVSLKCGHLFGKSCIEEWLKIRGRTKCPQCNARANKKDIRVIYARCLKVEDTTERDRLAKELALIKQKNAQYERETTQQMIKRNLDNQLITKLQNELRMLKEACKSSLPSTADGIRNTTTKYKLVLFQSFDLNSNKTSGCRVMVFNDWMNMLIVSVPSQVEMFPGCGIKTINTLDFKVENYKHLHSKQIRDFALNAFKRDLLLSVGFDKVAKITNIGSHTNVVSYTTNFPLWSCCWNSEKNSEFFVGTGNGLIYRFDTLKSTSSKEPLNTYKVSGAGPIVSLNYVPCDHSKLFCLSGLIVTRLNSVLFVELLENDIKEHLLEFEGSFSHTTFDPVSRLFLVSSRPGVRSLHARHILCELEAKNTSPDVFFINYTVKANPIYNFQGSTTMTALTRTCLASSPESPDNLVVLCSEESTNSVKVCDVRTTSQIQNLRVGNQIIDIVPVKGSNCHYVAMLSEKGVKLFKWVEQL